jgi:DNA-3-methyladenine glycosylase II
MAAPRVLTESSVRRAERVLRKSDPVMAELICLHGSCALADGRREDFFGSLALSIVSQQLSTKAADAIARRFLDSVRSLNASTLVRTDETILRSAGLSKAKARYLYNLASAVVSGELDLDTLQSLPDDEVVARLTSVSGIGRWTAQMFLIFSLKRPDVMSPGDAGLRRAARSLYNNELEEVAEVWRPYRSVASWYLWKYLDS